MMKTIKLKNYKLIKKIGWGGMGVVYIAEDLALGRQVALKFLPPYLVQDPEILDRFRAEARNQARLMHPNITMVYAFQETDDQAYLVLEYVDGETLENRLKRQGRLSVAETVRIFDKVLSAIDYAHHKGVIHRDIKPGNIGFTADGTVKVMDFGIALNIEESSRLTKTGHSLGTPHYMAPEQILGRQSDHRADIYALGITLYETLTGQLPFDNDSDYEIRVAQINQPPPPPRSFGYPDITPALEKVILKALAKDQEARFANVKEFHRALKAAVNDRHLAATGPAAKKSAATQSFQSMASPPPLRRQGRSLAERLAGRSSIIYGAVAAVVLVLTSIVLYQGFWAGSSSLPVKSISPQPPGQQVVGTAPAPSEKKTEMGSPTPAASLEQGRITGTGAKPTPLPVPSPPAPAPARPPIAPEPVKPQATHALPPQSTPVEKPAIKEAQRVISPAAIKTKLTNNGFSDIKVSLDEKNRMIISGQVKDQAKKKRLMQLIDSMGLTVPVDYELTLVKEKTVRKERTRKRRSASSQEESPQVQEAPGIPLPPKLD